MILSDHNTIAEAREIIFEEDNFSNGTNCPCCNQLVKKYNRKLNSAAALSLISLWKQSSPMGEDVHVSKIEGASSSGGNFAQLERWNLIEAVRNTDTQKRTSGFWHITLKGERFVKGLVTVPSYVTTYNMETLGFSEEHINIRQALGTKFDYTEMMRGYDLEETGQVSLL